MIRIYKRTWLGLLKCIVEFDKYSYRIVVSTAGVLTIRRKDHTETTVMALGPEEWSLAKEEDK